jgi:hypothetical protein
MLVLEGVTFAQAQNSSMPGAGSKRSFTVFGDLKVDESQAGDANTNLIFDVILYTRGNTVFQRQRVGNNGRYPFYQRPSMVITISLSNSTMSS